MSHASHHLVIDWPTTLALLVIGLTYVRGWFLLRRAVPAARSIRQLAAFAIGLSALWIALGSPLAAFHHELLSVHMVQHVLLMAVAPPVILLGAPLEPLLKGVLPRKSASRSFRAHARNRNRDSSAPRHDYDYEHRFAEHEHDRSESFEAKPLQEILSRWERTASFRESIQRMRAAVMHPVVCWLAPVAALIAWHVPAVFELGLHAPAWHALQAASFLVTGLLFWAPVVRPSPSFSWPRWSVPLYLFAATLPCDALSAFLVLCGGVVYPTYVAAPRVFDISPLRDQELAVSFMWVAVTLIYLVPASAITLQLLSPTEPGPDRYSTARGPDVIEPAGGLII